jgi:uncharacterized cupin superfamily protein
MPEARLTETEHGLVPEGEGWYVLNAREAAWLGNDELSTFCHFEGDAGWQQLGLNVCVVEPGHPNCMYHDEENQEGYLIVSGEAIVIVDGRERRVGPWDYVHLPPWTRHVLVGAGDRPCVFVAVGARIGDGGSYLPDPVAARHDAAVERETPDPGEAYARFSPIRPRRGPEGVLPRW